MIKIKYNYYGGGKSLCACACVQDGRSRTGSGKYVTCTDPRRAALQKVFIGRAACSFEVGSSAVRTHAYDCCARAHERTHTYTPSFPGAPRSVRRPPSRYDVTHYDSACSSRLSCDTVARLRSVIVCTTYLPFMQFMLYLIYGFIC